MSEILEINMQRLLGLESSEVEGSGKSNKRSDELRAAGNKSYKAIMFYDALIKYNAAICFGLSSGSQKALAFANRAAVYFELKEYNKCIENIQLANENGYPVSKKFQLDERQAKAEQQLSLGRKREKIHEEFFKLSHEANKKLPFIANCLKLQSNEKYGRYIITDKNLISGDIIAIEPIYVGKTQNMKYSHCHNCLKCDQLNLLPCDICTQAMFCSQKCIDEMKAFHNLEHDKFYELELSGVATGLKIVFKALNLFDGSVGKLKEFIEGNSNNTTVYDFDLSNPDNQPYEKHRLLAVNSLMFHKFSAPTIEETCTTFLEKHKNHPSLKSLLENEEKLNFLRTFCVNMSLKYMLNIHGMSSWIPDSSYIIQRERFGHGLFPFCSLLSHSCAQNANCVALENNLVVYVTRPIQAGQQIFISYGKVFNITPYPERQTELLSKFGFRCTCEACENHYPVHLQRKNTKDVLPNRCTFDSIACDRNKFIANNEYVNKYHAQHFPCIEIAMLNERSYANIGCIASEWLQMAEK